MEKWKKNGKMEKNEKDGEKMGKIRKKTVKKINYLHTLINV